jgi:uncharacterized protein YjbI with pentapeptide repeats
VPSDGVIPMPSGAIEPLMLVPVRAELERDVLRPPVRRVLDEVARAPVLLERLFVLLPLLRFVEDRFVLLRLAVARPPRVPRVFAAAFTRPVERLAVLRLAVLRLAVLRLAVLRLAVLRLAVLRFAVLRFAVLRFAVVRLAVLRLAVLRFAVVRLAVLRLAVLRLAVLRFAVVRLAVLRFAVLRLAVLRFAVVRLAVLRFAVLRFAVVRLAVLRLAVPLERLVDRRFVVLRRLVPPLERVLDPVDLLLAVAICSLLVGDVGGNADLCSMRAASADIQQRVRLSYFEMSSTRPPVCSSDAFRAMSAWATMPTSLPSSSTTGKRRT